MHDVTELSRLPLANHFPRLVASTERELWQQHLQFSLSRMIIAASARQKFLIFPEEEQNSIGQLYTLRHQRRTLNN